MSWRRAALMLVALALFARVASAERLPIRAYSVADGLAHNEVNKIVRDSRGLLWFATSDGLSRFDGYSFVTFGVEQGLPHPVVNDVIETRSGDLWVATNGGLVRFDPAGTPMFTPFVAEDTDRYASSILNLLEDRDGTIWCGAVKGLYRFDAKRRQLAAVDIGTPPTTPLYQRTVNALVQDQNGVLWIATPSGIYRRSNDGRVAHYGLESLPDVFIHDLLIDHAGRIWAASRHAGIFRLDVDKSGAPSVVEAYNEKNGLPSNWVFQLHESRDHHLWVGTNHGVADVSGESDGGARLQSYSTRNGLTFQEITAITEDASGNLWLGTNTAGAMKVTRNGFTTFGEQDGLAAALGVFEDGAGHVCVRGSTPGDPNAVLSFGCFNGSRFEAFTPGVPFDFGWVFEEVTIRAPDGHWWVGSGKGLFHYPALASFADIRTARPLAMFATKDGVQGPQPYRLFADSRGDVWISSGSLPEALARWDRATNRVIAFSGTPGLASLTNELPRSFAEDAAGNIWIGLNTGVARYRDNAFTFFTASDGIPSGNVVDMLRDRANRLWLASARAGLIRVEDPTAAKPTFTVYSTANGLSSNHTDVLVEDGNGRIYVATGRGVDQITPETGGIRHYTTADGLVPGTINTALRDSTGALWFGNHRGLSKLQPTFADSSPAPSILITGLTVGGEPWRVSAIGASQLDLPDLASDRHQLQIDFVALGSTPGEVLRYQYMLEGTDKVWSPAAEHRRVTYASLAPGSYRFLVRAVNADGATSPSPAAITFVVLRPIWQRSWFLALAALVLGASAYGVHRYRLAHALELERVRAHIADDLHDDIGANLTKISILSEVAKREQGSDNGDASPLGSIARISRESVTALSDIVWAVNPQRDSLRDVIRRMRLHAEETCDPRDISLEFRTPDVETAMKLGADTRRDLYLIFKEAVTNAARHSGCTKMQVVLAQERRALSLTVRDNGRGFEPSDVQDGNGVISMQRRARARGANLEILSSVSEGTTVSVTIPL